MVGQQGLTANSVVLAAPVVALGSIGWIPPGQGVVDGNSDSLSAVGGGSEERKRRPLAGSRSRR